MCISFAQAAQVLPLPRFIVLKSDDVNLRVGPGSKYPIKYNLRCKGYPMEMLAEFENWALLKDIRGNGAWAKINLISSAYRNGILIIASNEKVSNPIVKKKSGKDELLLLRLPDIKSRPLARIEMSSVVRLRSCKEGWCRVVTAGGYKGWISRNNLWGIYDKEIF